MSAIAIPVFPDPVIPTIRPWVTRSEGSSSTRPESPPVAGSNSFPM